ncbi:MAG: DUF1295 domain-containing protein [Rhodospirillales bacterium]|nr:DUF1295 domain-containing protein [Rhodospirillales bacterium]
MALAWAVQRALGNAGWVDAIWSGVTGLLGVGFALIPLGPPIGARQIVIAALTGLWGARLGIHIAMRSHGPAEDRRYAALRREWGGDFQRRMAVFLQIQALAAWLLALSVLAAARNPAPFPRAIDVAGIAIAIVALLGESLADAQLARFRADPAQAGRICMRGLWAVSRHPNYFFEWLGWCAWPLLALGSGYPAGWLGFLAPLLMYALLVHGSGIPPLERQMAARHGAAWDAYAARTRAFLPLPRFAAIPHPPTQPQDRR